MAITFDQIGELEMIARGGAVVVLKIDGERETDADIFTVMVSGGKKNVEIFLEWMETAFRV